MDLKLEILNNLNTYSEKISKKLKEQVEELILSNREYKVTEDILDQMNHGLNIIYYNSDDKVIAFGMIVRKNNLYEAKYLSVDPCYDKDFLNKSIYDLREKILREMGIREVYTETEGIESRVLFHKSRGYYEMPSPTKLVFSRFMKKDL